MCISIFLSRILSNVSRVVSAVHGYTGLSVGLPCLVSCGTGQGLRNYAIFTMGTVWSVLVRGLVMANMDTTSCDLHVVKKSIVSQGYSLIDINIMNINTVTCDQL